MIGDHIRVCVLAGSLIVAPLFADAQPAGVPRPGILAPATCSHPNFGALREGLAALGYVEGHSIIIECRSAAGRSEQLSALAAQMVALKSDVLLTDGTPAALAAQRATKTVPIVMATVGDPVGNGLVSSLARPGANITGLSLMNAEINSKRIELLKAVLPHPARVAVLANPGNPASAVGISGTEAAARSFGLATYVAEARREEDLDSAFADVLRRQVRALIVLPDPILYTHRDRIVALAAKSQLPAIYEAREFAEAGGLMAYGPEITANFRRAATYVDRILKGAKPGDLPVEQPTKFELVINVRTAKTLGLTLPPSLLARADQLIEQ